MAKGPKFKIVVKDGDSSYEYDAKTGRYEYGTKDYVNDYNNVGEALLAFLEYATDDYFEDKVTLTFIPAKGKNK